MRANHGAVTWMGTDIQTMIPLRSGEKFVVSAAAALAAFVNPERGDMIATLGETTGVVLLC